MDILGKARKLESRIGRALDNAAERVMNTSAREPLETMQAILEAVEEEVQPAGQGKYVFPFNRIKVSAVAASREARARLEAVFDGEPSIHERILERLRSAGCQASDLTTRTTYVSSAEADWTRPDFHIEFVRVTPVVPVAPQSRATPASIKLTVVHGSANQSAYSFTLTRIDVGRCVEVRDSRNRLIRTNHVAFADGAEELNQSVSRRHAHIDYTSDHYRICDDGSTHGTRVLRSGRTVVVPTGSRGIRLQSGDEIVLGEARLRIKIDQESNHL